MAATDGSYEDSSILWEIGVFDAHCHPTDQMKSTDSIPKMKAQALTVMATRGEDQELVAQLADKYGSKSGEEFSDGTLVATQCSVVPSFGWHPWFSHLLYDDAEQRGRIVSIQDKIQHYKSVLTPEPKDDKFISALPDPRPLSEFLTQTECYLERFPLALVGEIGLDRAFRIPKKWTGEEKRWRDENATPGSREGRSLSPYHVSMNHQKKILKAQLQLAGKHGRAVSVHSVQAHGAIFEVLDQLWAGHKKRIISNRERKRRGSVVGAHEADDKSDEFDQPLRGDDHQIMPMPFPPRICMHSYSGPPEPLKQFLRPSVPSDVFFSFSSAINFSNLPAEKVEQVIKALPGDRLLIESDLHCAGERMENLLVDVAKRMCRIKEWPVETGLRQLRTNWQKFVCG